MSVQREVSEVSAAAAWLDIDCWATAHRMRECGLDSEANRLWQVPESKRLSVFEQPHVVLTLLLNGYDIMPLIERLRHA